MDKTTNSEAVDRHLALLDPPNDWQPGAAGGFARFAALRQHRRPDARRWWWVAAATAAVCLALLTFPGLWRDGESAAGVRVLKDRQPAPDFSLTDSTGATLRLSDYRGKAVAINFWATWCRPCGTEIPMLNDFRNRYQGRGLEVIGMAMDDDGWNAVRPYLGKYQVDYRVVLGNAELARKYGADALPMTMLIDREGRLAVVHTGLVAQSVWEKEIAALLAR